MAQRGAFTGNVWVVKGLLSVLALSCLVWSVGSAQYCPTANMIFIVASWFVRADVQILQLCVPSPSQLCNEVQSTTWADKLLGAVICCFPAA